MPGLLFGRTSMQTLYVSQIEFEGVTHSSTQLLKIEPDFESKTIEFRFLDTQLEERQWNRSEPANGDALIKRLVGFLEQVGWKKH